MYTLLVIDMKVPKHIGIGRIRGRVSLMASIHRGKLDRIADKEHRLRGF